MTALNFYEAHNRNVLTHRQSLNWFRKCYDKNLNLVFLAFLYRRGFQQLFKTHPEDTVHHSRIWFLFLAILYLGFLLKLIIWWHSLFYLEITGNNANHNWKIHLTNSVEQMNHETIGRWIFNLLLKHETRLVSKPAAFFFFFFFQSWKCEMCSLWLSMSHRRWGEPAWFNSKSPEVLFEVH